MITADACRASSVASSTPNTRPDSARSAPSSVFSAMLPVKPSVTMTSTVSACMKSRPSTLPTNPGIRSSRGYAALRSSSPLPASSPLERSPMRGVVEVPAHLRVLARPSAAYCASRSGAGFTTAPASTSTCGC